MKRKLICTIMCLAIALTLIPYQASASYTYDEIYEKGYDAGYEDAMIEENSSEMGNLEAICMIVFLLISFIVVLDLLIASWKSFRKKEYKSGGGSIVETISNTAWWLPLVIAVAYIYGLIVLNNN